MLSTWKRSFAAYREKREAVAGKVILTLMALAEIRSASDSDSDDVIELVASVYREYAGCVPDVDGEMPHLCHVWTEFSSKGGRFWVAGETHGVLSGCVGVVPAMERPILADFAICTVWPPPDDRA